MGELYPVFFEVLHLWQKRFMTRRGSKGFGISLGAPHWMRTPFTSWQWRSQHRYFKTPASKVLAAIEKTDCFEGVNLIDFDTALEAGTIRYIDDKCLDDFVDAVLALRPGNDVSKLKLVYTPLNGSGLECVKKLLAKMGVENLTVVPANFFCFPAKKRLTF